MAGRGSFAAQTVAALSDTAAPLHPSLEALVDSLPLDLARLARSGVFTLDRLAYAQRVLGFTSLVDLLTDLERDAFREVSGLPDGAVSAMAAALPCLRTPESRVPLGRAVEAVREVVARIETIAGVTATTPIGSLRRGAAVVGDVEVLVATNTPERVLRDVLEDPRVTRCRYRADDRVYVDHGPTQIGVRTVPPSVAGAALLHLTGSRTHWNQLQSAAVAQGARLSPRGLVDAAGNTTAEGEEAIYQALGLPWIPPEIRHGEDELIRARQGGIPVLLSRTEVRGDLHVHTTWSDGRDSTEVMVQAAIALGYEYVAITDHSQRSTASRSLMLPEIPRQAEEIAALRERYPHIAILHGCEVDILPNGRLDFDDDVLERFDIVLASLHDRAGHSEAALMRRYLGALRHPLVSVITHPTNRQVPHRDGYALDYDHLFAVARETGTAVEVDGAPAHLDLDGVLARRAVEAGAMLVVDSDCHRADGLGTQMELGVVTARRGWVESRHVLNTGSRDAVRQFVQAKRSGRPAQL
jgi:DNA polymerase (family 10)